MDGVLSSKRLGSPFDGWWVQSFSPSMDGGARLSMVWVVGADTAKI